MGLHKGSRGAACPARMNDVDVQDALSSVQQMSEGRPDAARGEWGDCGFRTRRLRRLRHWPFHLLPVFVGGLLPLPVSQRLTTSFDHSPSRDSFSFFTLRSNGSSPLRPLSGIGFTIPPADRAVFVSPIPASNQPARVTSGAQSPGPWLQQGGLVEGSAVWPPVIAGSPPPVPVCHHYTKLYVLR